MMVLLYTISEVDFQGSFNQQKTHWNAKEISYITEKLVKNMGIFISPEKPGLFLRFVKE